jgi:hypothetical protein
MRHALLFIIALALAGWCSLAAAAYALVLSTPTRVAVIVVTCAEGEVSCPSVKYTEVNKETGLSITLNGSDWVRMCKDDVTPCQHLGFIFPHGDVTYHISDGGELSVTAISGKSVTDEVGKWLER